uniref:Killer cell lectin like receptor G1 n=1 Tax=Anas platyrhynchos platyrhynchos TaxID=8840 RepID=A0A493TCU7_ANAPP
MWRGTERSSRLVLPSCCPTERDVDERLVNRMLRLNLSLLLRQLWERSCCLHISGNMADVAVQLSYRGSCYSFSKEKKDWHSSQESCWAQGAHLLVISDTSEMNLFKSIQTACFWIGLRKTTGPDWIWEDGSILNVLSNSPVQQCAVLIRDLFQASSCEFSAAWICEKSLR